MRWITLLASLFSVAWIVAATMTFDGSDTVTVYGLRETNIKNETAPARISQNPTSYRVHNSSVVRAIGSSYLAKYDGFLTKYDNCAVLSVDDWKCEYSDGSGSFGFSDGEYWELPKYSDTEYVSRFSYVLNKCQWWIYEGGASFLMCLFIPFGV